MMPELQDIDSIPLLPSGKIDKQRLKGIYEERHIEKGGDARVYDELTMSVLKVVAGVLGFHETSIRPEQNFYQKWRFLL